MNINERPITLGAHEQWINDLVFSPDGALSASGSGESTVAIWQVDNRERLFRLAGHMGGMTRVAFSPDGQLLVTGAGDGYLLTWDVATGKKVAHLGSGGKGVTSLSVCATRPLLCVGREDGAIDIHNDLTGKGSIETLKIAANGGVKGVVSPDGKTLAVSDLYNAVTVWDMAALWNGPRMRFGVDHPFSLAFTADSRYLGPAPQ